MKISTLSKILNGELIGKDSDFNAVSIDSRAIKKDDCFFAIKGDVFDGHDFIADVAAKEIAVAVVDCDIPTSIPLIKVSDTRKALIDLARYYRQNAAVPVVGIAGSCGKTTTRAMVESILKQAGNVLASQKSFNNDIGLPLTLLKLKSTDQFIVLEIGTNHPGEIAALTAIAQPTVSVVTMVAGVHIEGFGSVEKIAEEKAQIYAGLSQDGIAIINADDVFADYFKKIIGTRHVITFGIKNKADVFAKNIKVNKEGKIDFTLHIHNETTSIALPLLGEHNVVNALAAAAIAHALNVSVENIKTGLETVAPEYGRLNIKTGVHGATIIDDSYNANPTSVKAAIDVLTHQSANSILVLGDMKELGEGAENLHGEIGEYALKHGVKKLFCYGKMSAHAADAFGKNAFHFDDQQKLIDALKPALSKDITVLIKGSNSMKMVNIANALLM